MTNETGSENSRAVDKPWLFQPGQTANPGGRPKSFANYIRTLSLDGEKLVDKVWSILQHPKGKGLQAQKLQLECIQWLADRGWVTGGFVGETEARPETGTGASTSHRRAPELNWCSS